MSSTLSQSQRFWDEGSRVQRKQSVGAFTENQSDTVLLSVFRLQVLLFNTW